MKNVEKGYSFYVSCSLFSNIAFVFFNFITAIDCSLLEFNALIAIPCTLGLQAGH